MNTIVTPQSFETFGALLVYLRKRIHLTQDQFGRAVGYGREQIVRLEKDQRVPDLSVIAAVFIPALELNDRPEWSARLLQLAAQARHAAGSITITRTLKEQIVATETIEQASPQSKIPVPMWPLLGREAELDRLDRMLIDPHTRLITLLGAPGVGKTRLALQATRDVHTHFTDGAHWIDLSPVNEASSLADVVRQFLDLPESVDLLDYFRGHAVLLVLDNFEQIIEAALDVAHWLEVSPHLKILITSRIPLHIYGEQEFSLAPLSVPDLAQLPAIVQLAQIPSMALFVARAQAVQPMFQLTASNALSIAACVVRMDGLPLAIELAAAQIKLLSPQELAAKLVTHLMQLSHGLRIRSERQQTLYGAIAWSFDRLNAETQKMLARLSVFSAGFTRDAAEFVGERDRLIDLIDANLVYASGASIDPPRFNLLMTIQEFALDRLRATNGEAAARDRHLAYFLDLAEQADRAMRGPDQAAWSDRIEHEYDNFHAALGWSVASRNAESALRLMCALSWPWEVRGHLHEARQWLDKIRALPEIDQCLALYAKLLNHIGRQSWLQENFEDARLLFAESQALSLHLGEAGLPTLADSLNWQGLSLAFNEADVYTAKSLFERSRELYGQLRDGPGVALTTFHLGLVAQNLKQNDVALPLFEQSMAMFKKFGDLFFINRVSLFLGHLYLDQGRFDNARACFEKELELATELHYWDGLVEGWRDLGYLYRQQGQYDRSSQCYEEGVAICINHNLDVHGVDILYPAGLMALYCNNYALARQRFVQALGLFKGQSQIEKTLSLLLGLAAVAGGTHQPDRSARIFGAAGSALDRAGVTIPDSDRSELNRHIRLACDDLGETEFDRLVAEGRSMPLAQAIELALSETRSWTTFNYPHPDL